MVSRRRLLTLSNDISSEATVPAGPKFHLWHPWAGWGGGGGVELKVCFFGFVFYGSLLFRLVAMAT